MLPAPCRGAFKTKPLRKSDVLLARAHSGEHLFVPAHWPAEILNGLTRATRRGRIDAAGVDRFLAFFPSLNIFVDDRSMSEQWTAAVPLTRLYQLSGYDALYLSLAKHLDLPLVTFDGRLRDAAIAENVPLAM